MARRIELERTIENHGEMPWTGEFDEEGRAIFECLICGRKIALGGPAKLTYKRLAQGNFWASHSAYTTLEIMKAALEQELWPQLPHNHEAIDAWEKAGGGPLFTISKVEVTKGPAPE